MVRFGTKKPILTTNLNGGRGHAIGKKAVAIDRGKPPRPPPRPPVDLGPSSPFFAETLSSFPGAGPAAEAARASVYNDSNHATKFYSFKLLIAHTLLLGSPVTTL